MDRRRREKTDILTGATSALGNKDTELVSAAANGDCAAVARLLAAGAGINCVDIRYSLTPLAAAAAASRLETLRTLIRRGADINAIMPSTGETALGVAASLGHHDAVLILIKAGAKVDLTSRQCEYTPLMHAVLNGHGATARALLAAGADPLQTSVLGCSAASLAEGKEGSRMASLLDAHRATPARKPRGPW
ncbi:ankyrin repeat domain-containing protein [Piscinibacter sp. HJYY11]|uniref:ankyrin repeat domain-containing protein n=1 Tax=Piscinibacter sp. HJYY11 TaxID=2801333 RepID=UPI0038572646